MFSSDYRAAVIAEAAGDYDTAAERFALAKHFTHATRMHLLRAKRASSRDAEITALRDALHWAPPEDAQKIRAQRELGLALFAKVKASPVPDEREKKWLLEAAQLLSAAGEHKRAGDAYMRLGNLQSAVVAYSSAGAVELVEELLQKEETKLEDHRSFRDNFSEYEMLLRTGERSKALHKLAECLPNPHRSAEVRRLYDELQAKILSGSVTLSARSGETITVIQKPAVMVGRDETCDWIVRVRDVSRQHLQLTWQDEKLTATQMGKSAILFEGMPLPECSVLPAQGRLILSPLCEFALSCDQNGAHFAGHSPMVQNQHMRYLRENHRMAVLPQLPAEVGFALVKNVARPCIWPSQECLLNGQNYSTPCELIRGDVISINGVEVDVG